MNRLDIRFADVSASIECDDSQSSAWISHNFGELASASATETELSYVVTNQHSGGYTISSNQGRSLRAADSYELLYLLEKSITMDVQLIRKDLLFLHAAAVEYNDRGYLLVGPSGAGKSTTTWALANRGFGYLSDELAPIDLNTLTVYPYPHALCLKAEPPAPFGLPKDVLSTTHTHHIAARRLRVVREPLRLHGVFFNVFDRAASEPTIDPTSPGEAAATLYANALNLRAHEAVGLKAVANLATNLARYRLSTAELEATVALLKGIVQGRPAVNPLQARSDRDQPARGARTAGPGAQSHAARRMSA